MVRFQVVITLEQWNLSAAEESRKPQGPMEKVCIIIYVGHICSNVGALAPVMDLVISRQGPSPSPAGNQPDRT